MLDAEFVGAELVGPHARTFGFRPYKPLQYVAGQFTELTLLHDKPDTRGEKRWFTLSSSPSEELLSITTKIVPQSSSFKKRLSELRPGEVVSLATPMGDFVLPIDKTIPLIFIAIGMGITPMRSMIKWLTDQHEHRNVQLLYAPGSSAIPSFQKLFIDYGARVMYTEEHVTTQHLRQLGQVDNGRLVYLAGPEHTVEELRDKLLALGWNQHSLLVDYFHGYDTNP